MSEEESKAKTLNLINSSVSEYSGMQVCGGWPGRNHPRAYDPRHFPLLILMSIYK